MSGEGPEGAGSVADRRWTRVREIAADIQRLEALDRSEGLDDDARIELGRLRIQAERASTRAMLADDLADRIDQARRRKASGS
ncbi:MAG: hypothetical protein ACO3PB_02555 [Miltoncostaeaceae bacterium]